MPVQQLGQLPGQSFRVVRVDLTKISDTGLVQIAGAPNLRELWLNDTQITDAATDSLKKLASAEFVHLGEPRFKGTRLEELAALSKLASLWLAAYTGHVPASHLRKLANLPALQFVGIGGVSDEHLAEIAQLKQVGRSSTGYARPDDWGSRSATRRCGLLVFTGSFQDARCAVTFCSLARFESFRDHIPAHAPDESWRRDGN